MSEPLRTKERVAPVIRLRDRRQDAPQEKPDSPVSAPLSERARRAGAVVAMAPVRGVVRVGRGTRVGAQWWLAWIAQNKSVRIKQSAWTAGALIVWVLVAGVLGIIIVVLGGAVAAAVAGRPRPGVNPAARGSVGGPAAHAHGGVHPAPAHPRAQPEHEAAAQPSAQVPVSERPPAQHAVSDWAADERSAEDALARGVIDERVIGVALTWAEIIKPGQRSRIRFEQAPVRGERGVWTTTLLLPPGVLAAKATAAEEALASALGVGMYQVAMRAQAGTHAGRLRIAIADEDPFITARTSPLLDLAEPLDIWAGVPAGVDAQLEPVTMRIVDASLLVAGAPRAGKTVALKSLVAAFALAVSPRVHVCDGKGAGDFGPWRRVLATYIKRQAAKVKAHLEGRVAEMEDRFDRLDGHGGKLTPDLEAELGMPLDVTILDETRYYMSDEEHGKDIRALAIDLASRGPAAGVLLVAASQYLNKDAIPPLLKGTCTLRWAFRCPSPMASNLVLGEGAVGRGYDASAIPNGPSHRGVGVLDADGDDPRYLKGYYLGDEDERVLVERAVRLREEAGTLPTRRSEEVVEEAAPGTAEALGLLRQAVALAGGREVVPTAEIASAWGQTQTMAGRMLRAWGAPSDESARPRGPWVSALEAAITRIEGGGPVEVRP